MPKFSCLYHTSWSRRCSANIYSAYSRASNVKHMLHIRCTDMQILTFLMAHRQYSQQTKCKKCQGQVKYQHSCWGLMNSLSAWSNQLTAKPCMIWSNHVGHWQRTKAGQWIKMAATGEKRRPMVLYGRQIEICELKSQAELCSLLLILTVRGLLENTCITICDTLSKTLLKSRLIRSQDFLQLRYQFTA